MEKRKKYIEEAAEKETVRLFNNSLLHPEFKFGFILGMTHADKVPFIKNHKVYDTISKDVIDLACSVFSDILIEICPELLGYGAGVKAWENKFRKRLEGGAE